MTVSSEIDIYNLAFDHIGETSATSPDDDRPIVKRAKANYQQAHRALLRANIFRFSLDRAELAKLNEKPAFGWSYQYNEPIHSLRVLPLTHNGEFDGNPVDHRFEGGKILTNQNAPLKVRFVSSNISVSNFDPIYVDLLAADLARRICYRMTNKRSLVAELKDLVREISSSAAFYDSLLGTAETAQGDDIIEAGWGYSS